MDEQVSGTRTVAYFYRIRWGYHEEWLDLFRRNHWPVLCDQVRSGRFTDIRLFTPRFHGDGRADWNALVTITYRDWSALDGRSDAAIKERLYPDQATFKREEQRRFELTEAHWDVPLDEVPLPRDAVPLPRDAVPLPRDG
jgi:hypothetical protein